MGNTKINSGHLKTSTETLKALCHPLRMRILQFVNENENINMNKICNAFDLEQSTASQHLRTLKNAGLISKHRDGKRIYYDVEYDKVATAVAAVDTFLKTEAISEVRD